MDSRTRADVYISEHYLLLDERFYSNDSVIYQRKVVGFVANLPLAFLRNARYPMQAGPSEQVGSLCSGQGMKEEEKKVGVDGAG